MTSDGCRRLFHHYARRGPVAIKKYLLSAIAKRLNKLLKRTFHFDNMGRADFELAQK